MADGLQPARQPIGRPRRRPIKLHGDKGYDYPGCRELLRDRNITHGSPARASNPRPTSAGTAISSNAAC